MSEAEDSAMNQYLSTPVVDGAKSLWRKDAYLYERRKLDNTFFGFQTKLTEFQRFYTTTPRNKYSLSQIGTTDETAVLDMPHNYTVNLEEKIKWQWKPEATKS
jgi:hypothetical protein